MTQELPGCWFIPGSDDPFGFSSEGYVDIEDLIQAALGLWPEGLAVEFSGAPMDLGPEENGLLWRHCIDDQRSTTLTLPALSPHDVDWVMTASSDFLVPLNAQGVQTIHTLFRQRCSIEIASHFHLRRHGALLMTGYDYPSYLLFAPEIPETEIASLAMALKKSYAKRLDMSLTDPRL
ncbi:MAG: hypothetical protein RL095_2342 [Verrucomicrobiota bacterium]